MLAACCTWSSLTTLRRRAGRLNPRRERLQAPRGRQRAIAVCKSSSGRPNEILWLPEAPVLTAPPICSRGSTCSYDVASRTRAGCSVRPSPGHSRSRQGPAKSFNACVRKIFQKRTTGLAYAACSRRTRCRRRSSSSGSAAVRAQDVSAAPSPWRHTPLQVYGTCGMPLHAKSL